MLIIILAVGLALIGGGIWGEGGVGAGAGLIAGALIAAAAIETWASP